MQIKDAMVEAEFLANDSGYLVAHGILARTGIQLYRAMEISDELEGDPTRIIRVYRPHSEVFDKASMASFENRPVTVDHPNDPVGIDNWKDHAVGEVRDVRREGDFMVGTVIVKDQRAIKAIEDGHSQLSNGYVSHLDMTPGVTPSGEEYDAVQRQIRGNHVALVKRARCGEACKLTSDSEGDDTMEEELKAALARIKELEAQLAEMETVKDESEEAATVAKDALPVLETKLADAEKRIAVLSSPAHIAEAAKSWAKMVSDGEKIAPGFVPDSAETAVDYQRAVVRKAVTDSDSNKNLVLAITGGKTVCDSCEDTVQSAFRLLAAIPAPVADSSEVGKKFIGKDSENDEKATVLTRNFI
jgi:Uncharacterized protein conserved in bacteria